LIGASKKDGKTAIFLKPCDSFSFNQLVKEHRIVREKIHVIAIECQGKLSVEKIKGLGVSMITEATENGDEICVSSLYGEYKFTRDEVLLGKCETCKSKTHQVKDEEIIFN
jgi:hypothetical protein